jgi:hypothetical protein
MDDTTFEHAYAELAEAFQMGDESLLLAAARTLDQQPESIEGTIAILVLRSAGYVAPLQEERLLHAYRALRRLRDDAARTRLHLVETAVRTTSSRKRDR